jgi:tetratricopeptide (TPR) repeat protein
VTVKPLVRLADWYERYKEARAFEQRGGAAATLITAAMRWREVGRHARAIRCLERALSLVPTQHERVWIADSFARLDERSRALGLASMLEEEVFRRERSADTIRGWSALAEVYERCGDQAAARLCLARAETVAAGEGIPHELWVDLARDYTRLLGDTSSAHRCLRGAAAGLSAPVDIVELAHGFDADPPCENS